MRDWIGVPYQGDAGRDIIIHRIWCYGLGKYVDRVKVHTKPFNKFDSSC